MTAPFSKLLGNTTPETRDDMDDAAPSDDTSQAIAALSDALGRARTELTVAVERLDGRDTIMSAFDAAADAAVETIANGWPPEADVIRHLRTKLAAAESRAGDTSKTFDLARPLPRQGTEVRLTDGPG